MSKVIDLVGQKIGKLIVIRQDGFDRWRSSLWLCRCDCGKEKTVNGGRLTSGKTRSCGCARFGRVCSEGTKRKRSESAKIRWANPEFKKRVAKKIGEASKRVWSDPQHKVKMSALLTGRRVWNKGTRIPDGYRQKLSEAHKGIQAGERHPMFGRKHSKETLVKLRESHLGKPPAMSGKKHSKEAREKMSKSRSGVPLSDKHREAIGKASKRAWSTVSTEKKNQWVKNCRAGLQCTPNKPESKLLSILDELYPGEWRFVGDGQVVIAGKCPDFINVNGQKKIIELFGSYWHKGQDPREREIIFEPFGYKTLVIWEHDLKHMSAVKKRIHAFMVA